MTIFCNYNIPNFNLFGALTMGVGGYSVPNFGCFMPMWCGFNPVMSAYNPFLAAPPIWNSPDFTFNVPVSNEQTQVQTQTSTQTQIQSNTNIFGNFGFSSMPFSMPQINTPSFNFTFTTPTLNTNDNKIGDTFTRTINYSISSGGGKMSLSGYNKDKGVKLTNAALKRAGGRSSSGDCSKYVRMAMQDTGLHTGHPEHAADFIPILDKNPNFKRIYVDNVHDLPAGCIVVYGRGVGNYSIKSGHIEIATGDGRAVSDFVNENLHKKPTAVYMPV